MYDYEFTWDLSDIIIIIITILIIIAYIRDHKNTVGAHTLGRCHPNAEHLPLWMNVGHGPDLLAGPDHGLLKCCDFNTPVYSFP
jgi:hypothetical protein